MDLLKILDGTPEPPIIDLQLSDVNNSGEYNLPTPMFEFQKELTDQIVSLHYPDILKFSETDDSNDSVIKSLEICYKNCIVVSLHPYLLIDHYMPKNLAQKDMSSKLAETSGKFSVLRDLMNVIISSKGKINKNIAIVTENKVKIFDLIEALLIGCKGDKTVKRYVGNTIRGGKGRTGADKNTLIHLIPSDGKLTKEDYDISKIAFDMIIVFDSNVDTESIFFQQLRTQNRSDSAVIIRLIPMKAVEHCQLYYKNDQKNLESTKSKETYLYNLISSIVCLREHIGILPPDLNPIYIQNLNYLAPFVTAVLQGEHPAWPLPELPDIPHFSPQDVERSLLTEAHYHYTPYDTIDNGPSLDGQKESYYEHRKRNEYVTNPHKSLHTLSGIFQRESSNSNTRTLTHQLILSMNTTYLKWKNIKNEHEWYLKFNDEVSQNKVGRREKDIRKVLSTIIDDVDHANLRINAAENKRAKKNIELDLVKKNITQLQNDLDNYLEKRKVNSLKLRSYYNNQILIWELKKDIQNKLNKIKLKMEEKEYMTKEITKAESSVFESENQIKDLERQRLELTKELEESMTTQDNIAQDFSKKRNAIMAEIEIEQEKSEALKLKLSKSWRFLRQTSHLKKRKGRSGTPSK